MQVKFKDQVFNAEQATEECKHGGIVVPIGYWKLTTVSGHPVPFAPSDSYFKEHYTAVSTPSKRKTVELEVSSSEE